MPLPRASADLYRANQRRSLALYALIRGWQGSTTPRLVAAVSAAMAGAGDDGWRSTGAALAQQGSPIRPDLQMRPGVMGATASDGRPLAGLLEYAEQVTSDTPGHRPAKLAAGRTWLEMVVRTQVADAARAGLGLGVVTREGVGYTRMVNPPCCQRCAVLAGKTFRWNTGFQRHPRCDCLHVPTALGRPGYVSVVEAGQVKDLTAAQRQALDDGADLGQVLNASRGRRADGMTTSEGTTRRGFAAHRMATTSTRSARLTPEAIYRVASTRDEALTLLRRYGYLL